VTSVSIPVVKHVVEVDGEDNGVDEGVAETGGPGFDSMSPQFRREAPAVVRLENL
jgi:hypothetical protein